ncbi:MAG TPA: aminoacyl-tRNA hydrolase [Deltaproteobacteria bacterium]|jgi:PTH1 family peptidyl-tRNA hydrolase|nr:aminoacyl-tRNA hydrolase [Deltaproteobacteria bacterium]HOI08479.1 aminoacyl-tRNA hydrolase [Deltaproteobacteria bacterium]
MKLIYGLGNPGRQYAYTRHNIGFLVTDFLSEKWRISLKSVSRELASGRGIIMRVPVTIARPLTYMNLSGIPLKGLNIEVEDLIVIHDDMDLPAGSVRVKLGGGTGGHKGLDSIQGALGETGFIRIRCGIGRPPEGMDPSDYVLDVFPEEDLPMVRKQLENAASAIEMCLRDGHVKAMNTFNRREKEPAENT